MAKPAGDRASSADVKKFAEKMVTDHTKANEGLEKMASWKSLKVPHTLDADRKAKLEMLNKKSGAKFDRAYVQVQVTGHETMQHLLDHGEKTARMRTSRPSPRSRFRQSKSTIRMAKELNAKIGK